MSADHDDDSPVGRVPKSEHDAANAGRTEMDDVSLERNRLLRGGPRQWRKLVEKDKVSDAEKNIQIDDPLDKLRGEDLYEHLKRLAEQGEKRSGVVETDFAPEQDSREPSSSLEHDDAFPDDVEFFEARWEEAGGYPDVPGLSEPDIPPPIANDGAAGEWEGDENVPGWMGAFDDSVSEHALQAMVADDEVGAGEYLPIPMEVNAPVTDKAEAERDTGAPQDEEARSDASPSERAREADGAARGGASSSVEGEDSEEWDLDDILSAELDGLGYDHAAGEESPATDYSIDTILVTPEGGSSEGTTPDQGDGDIPFDTERREQQPGPAEGGEEDADDAEVLELSEFLVEVDAEDENSAPQEHVVAEKTEAPQTDTPETDSVHQSEIVSESASPGDTGETVPRATPEGSGNSEMARMSALRDALEEIGAGGRAPVVVDELRPVEMSAAGYVNVQEEVIEIEGDEAEEDDTLSTALGELEGSRGAVSVTPPGWEQTPSSDTIRVLDGGDPVTEAPSEEGEMGVDTAPSGENLDPDVRAEAQGRTSGVSRTDVPPPPPVAQLEEGDVESLPEQTSVHSRGHRVASGAVFTPDARREEQLPLRRKSPPERRADIQRVPVDRGHDESTRPWWLPPATVAPASGSGSDTKSGGIAAEEGGEHPGFAASAPGSAGNAYGPGARFRSTVSRGDGRAPSSERGRTQGHRGSAAIPPDRSSRGGAPQPPGRGRRPSPVTAPTGTWNGQDLPFPVDTRSPGGESYRTLFDWPGGERLPPSGQDLWGGMATPSWDSLDAANGVSPNAYFRNTRVDDRRTRPRIVGLTGVAYFRRKGRIVTGELGNLSSTGAMVRTRTPVPPGTNVPVALELPGLSRPIRLMARVVYVRRVRLPSGREVAAMGLFFGGGADAEHRLLLRYLAQLGV